MNGWGRRLEGAWKLVSHTRISGDGKRTPTGRDVKGLLLYSAGGRMSVLITFGKSRKLERASSGLIAYAGRYSVRGRAVRHHVQIAARESQVGAIEVRNAALSANGRQLLLSTPPERDGTRWEILWRRAEGK